MIRWILSFIAGVLIGCALGGNAGAVIGGMFGFIMWLGADSGECLDTY